MYKDRGRIRSSPRYVFLGLIGALVLFGLIALASNARADSLIDRVKGRILLQVQEHGEAWYVHPSNLQRYFMGRPTDAFNLMRDLGVGISNQNIAKIPIAEDNLSGFDRDNDGLSDMIENAISTDINKQDSDGDGHSDKAELLNGYNPMSRSDLKIIDLAFANNQKGKIFLQVERHGESWYVNPVDGKRYFLGRPADAFSIMRRLGLGIANDSLSKISEHKTTRLVQTTPIQPPATSSAQPSVVTPAQPPIVSPIQPPVVVPVQPPELQLVSTGCHQNYFKMAFILAGRNSAEITPSRIEKITQIKNIFDDKFFESTSNLAKIDTSYDVVAVVGDSFWRYGNIYIEEMTQEFYKNNPDNFDFITIFATVGSNNESASHGVFRNIINGIGLDVVNNGQELGSTNKLLGTNYLGSIDRFEPDANELWANALIHNVLLHETGHQWCCHVGDNFIEKPNSQLEIIQDGMHFYRGLESPFQNGTPMNSDYWVSNGDGTYRRGAFNEQQTLKYHPFELYFMGLLDEKEYSKKYKIFNAGVSPNWNFDRATIYGEVSINDIIRVEGPRQCQQ